MGCYQTWLSLRPLSVHLSGSIAAEPTQPHPPTQITPTEYWKRIFKFFYYPKTYFVSKIMFPFYESKLQIRVEFNKTKQKGSAALSSVVFILHFRALFILFCTTEKYRRFKGHGSVVHSSKWTVNEKTGEWNGCSCALLVFQTVNTYLEVKGSSAAGWDSHESRLCAL